jgi:hypothetical protein
MNARGYAKFFGFGSENRLLVLPDHEQANRQLFTLRTGSQQSFETFILPVVAYEQENEVLWREIPLLAESLANHRERRG